MASPRKWSLNECAGKPGLHSCGCAGPAAAGEPACSLQHKVSHRSRFAAEKAPRLEPRKVLRGSVTAPHLAFSCSFPWSLRWPLLYDRKVCESVLRSPRAWLLLQTSLYSHSQRVRDSCDSVSIKPVRSDGVRGSDGCWYYSTRTWIYSKHGLLESFWSHLFSRSVFFSSVCIQTPVDVIPGFN